MKPILFFLLILATNRLQAEPQRGDTAQLSQFIKIWGVLKYHHPAVSRGDFDMNAAFLDRYEQMSHTTTSSQFELDMLQWIAVLDQKNTPYKLRKNTESELYVDYSWITEFKNEQLRNKLIQITQNENIGHHYAKLSKMTAYVALKDESTDFVFDKNNRAHQLLFYASFWNSMQFWNVNITLNDKKWGAILEQTLDLFLAQQPPLPFDEIKDQLLAQVKDSHSDNIDISQIGERAKYFAAFRGRIVNDSLVVTDLLDFQKSSVDAIGLGDVIYQINGMPLKTYIDQHFDIARSNDLYVRGRIEKWLLLTSDTPELKVSILKKDSQTVEEKKIHLYDNKTFDYSQHKTLYTDYTPLYKNISEDIGYINLARITKSELGQAFKKLSNTKAIVIDIRNYPMGIRDSEIIDFLTTNQQRFIKIVGPTFPGQRAVVDKNILEKFLGNISFLKDNKKGYTGILVVLVDRNTISKAEFITLKLQKYHHTYTIGEQTGGAVMNTNTLKLLNGQSFTFTNDMAMDPDDNYTVQRNGIKLDKNIKETARSFEPNSYILEAVKYIESQ